MRLGVLPRTTVRSLGVTVGCFACAHPHAAPPAELPPSPGLSCLLHELGQRGYALRYSADGSSWIQAYRSRRAGGDEIWLRVVPRDSIRAELDLRARSWVQQPGGAQPAPPLTPRGREAVPRSPAEADRQALLARCGAL